MANAGLGVLRVEQLGCVAHCNADVGPQLVVGEGLAGAVDVLVYAPAVHELLSDIVRFVFLFALWNPEAALEVVSHPACPLAELDKSVPSLPVDSDSRALDGAIPFQVREPSEDGVLHCDQLDGSTVPGRGGHSPVSGQVRAAHLVHPSATVILVAAEAESCLVEVTVDLDVEPVALHVRVDGRASVPLTELDALTVPLDNLENELQDRQGSTLTCPEVCSLVVITEVKLEALFKELVSLF